MADIAIYVNLKYARQTYSVESYESRYFYGVEAVAHSLKKAGYEVDYCNQDTAHQFKVVLVSLVGLCDWWTYIAERSKWSKSAKPYVIVGGPAVMNVRPVLPFFDLAVFGRGEDIILPVMDALLKNKPMPDDPCLCFSATFSVEKQYKMKQAVKMVEKFTASNGKEVCEDGVGCPRRCLFCNYTWTRKFFSAGKDIMGEGGNTMGQRSAELTMFNLDLEHPESWPDTFIVGLDGCSERLRYMVNKNISRERFRRFMTGLPNRGGKTGYLRLYNLIGLPTETQVDLDEFLEDIDTVAALIKPGGRRILIANHFTPFQPMPVTPSAIWPASYKCYHSTDLFPSRKIKTYLTMSDDFSVNNDNAVDSLACIFLNLIMIRGTEADTDKVYKLSRTEKFWNSRMPVQVSTLEKNFDAARYFGEYTWENLPTRYLTSYTPDHLVRKMSQRYKTFADGIPARYKGAL